MLRESDILKEKEALRKKVEEAAAVGKDEPKAKLPMTADEKAVLKLVNASSSGLVRGVAVGTALKPKMPRVAACHWSNNVLRSLRHKGFVEQKGELWAITSLGQLKAKGLR